MHLRSAHVKAASKILMKLSPGVTPVSYTKD